jgi:hypothetical protein
MEAGRKNMSAANAITKRITVFVFLAMILMAAVSKRSGRVLAIGSAVCITAGKAGQ